MSLNMRHTVFGHHSLIQAQICWEKSSSPNPPLQKLFRCLSLSSLLLICMLARTAGWWLLCVIHPCSALLVKLMNHQSPGIKEPEGLQCLSPFPLFTAPSVTPSRGVGHVNAQHWWQEYSLKIFQGIGIMAAMVKVIRDDVAWSM